MLPEILLDDVRFQELVSEARTRIVRHSPDWTEHNVSDPGITLIELFAWMTEMTIYRGSNPYAKKRWDAELKLFLNAQQDPRMYPTPLGYEEVGRVVAETV